MSEAPPAAPPGDCTADFTHIAGPYVLGHLLSYGIFGVLFVQIYVYTVAFKHDPKWLRILVYTIFAIEVAFQSIETYMAWWSLGTGWGKLPNLLGFPSPTISFTTLTGLVTSLVHGFYGWRIAKLMRGYVVVVIIAALSLVQLSMTIYVTVHLAQSQGDAAAATLQTTSRIITVWLAFAAAADIVITVAMSNLLLDARRRSHFTPTNTRLQNLTKYTVETGLVTTCAVLIDLILFLSVPTTNYHYIIFYSIGKIYANTLMATLNARITFVTSQDQTPKSDTALMFMSENDNNGLWKDMQKPSAGTSPKSDGGREGDLRVNVAKTTLVLQDDDTEGIEIPTKHSRRMSTSGGDVGGKTLVSDGAMRSPTSRDMDRSY
ncbi:hypothetical protein BDV98DRAFT_523645 [Pterulicium gracile]|uniref:DUF6534 domain-containing protein n=1 Tax=Pterulicium gracile TaxID=1884261 RepID=A0A5C3QU64_9AGAR|nr:hypothetical protein BDV98DRAFT_523645 [Pterula gracilis]